jgi:4-aminobutyrate aminotransferase / (S)-3-amino-2-methylpropionate transaminase / 5-aminovalerate transaminase
VPDLITTAKGLAGGLPLAAVTGRADIMDAAHPGGIGGTYSGNPVACAAALGVFDEIETHQLLNRAQVIGDILVRELRDIAAATEVIGEIRGRGAMIAAELVVPGSRAPNRDAVAAVTRHCQNNGVLTLTAGTFGNVLRFLPPLSISDALLTEALNIVRDAFATL